MSTDSRLERYKSKRDFSKTSEPEGGAQKKRHGPLFVIQKHDASHLHYDFRLEIDGVLVSFAVPKGPSEDTEDKRLAVRTEDHPLGYATFEGEIPQGQYGAGTVEIWDTGTFDNISEKNGRELTAAQGLEAGHLRVRLHGRRLQGAYSLVHAKLGGEEKNWLLIKEKGDGPAGHGRGKTGRGS